MEFSFIIANTSEHFADGRMLFEEYAASLNFDLCFQGFTEELNQLELHYNAPNGALIIAYANQIAVAAVGIRQFENQKAELKRMYTQPAYRGKKIGHALLEMAIKKATELSYSQLLLDTLPEMKAAITLYESFGFIKTTPYRYNPFDSAIYMVKDLDLLNKN
jgi:putative acetyltransferase